MAWLNSSSSLVTANPSTLLTKLGFHFYRLTQPFETMSSPLLVYFVLGTLMHPRVTVFTLSLTAELKDSGGEARRMLNSARHGLQGQRHGTLRRTPQI